jgi:hypothetical protein
MRKRNLVNLHVYASQTVKKKCMKPVMVRLKGLLSVRFIRHLHWWSSVVTVSLFSLLISIAHVLVS